MEEKIIDVEATETTEITGATKPTIDLGNYIVEIISEGQVIKKIAVAHSEINITKLADGGLTIDLK